MTIDQLIHLIQNPETKDKGASILNDIIHEAYDIHLVTCPQCGQIHAFLPDSTISHDCTCGILFRQ